MNSAPSMHASKATATARTGLRPARRRSPRTAGPAPVPLPSLDRLDATHRQMLQMLDALDSLVTAPPQGERAGIDDTARIASDACSFFGVQARAHHDAEETQVFPAALQGADPELLAHVRHLQQDHNWIEEDWLELEPHLQALAQGWRQEHMDFLRDALPEFTELVRAHIALEESVIYPEARRHPLVRSSG